MSVVPAEILPGAPAEEADGVRGEEGLGPRARMWPSLVAVYRAQLSRGRVARIPLLFVATFQSIGVMIMLRGVVDAGGDDARFVVAGGSVLVVAFVGLNLLAQYFGQLRGNGGLADHTPLTLPPAAGGLGGAGAYAPLPPLGALVAGQTSANRRR